LKRRGGCVSAAALAGVGDRLELGAQHGRAVGAVALAQGEVGAAAGKVLAEAAERDVPAERLRGAAAGARRAGRRGGVRLA
jgi:hypothetical protein